MGTFYDDCSGWWPLLSRPQDYAEEAALYLAALQRHATGPLTTLLELGSGGGNLASHLAPHLALTLVDRSAGMLEVGRRLIPQARHHQGDMRSVRLGRTFDVVLVQDAIHYLTSEDDLRALATTARAHLATGGLVLWAPDHTRETYEQGVSEGGHAAGERSLHFVQTDVDPNPNDTTTEAHFVIRMREGTRETVREEVHTLGLFSQQGYLDALAVAGFAPCALPYAHSSFATARPRALFLGHAR